MGETHFALKEDGVIVRSIRHFGQAITNLISLATRVIR
jgi:hypothetical protein